MKIVTWNVNSIKARLGQFLPWLDTSRPDVVLLQETKCIDQDFPRLEIESRGYTVALRGQKAYNGVAILSRPAILEVTDQLDGDAGESRYIEARIEGDVTVASVYVPMGQSVESDRFPFKLAFLDALRARAQSLLDEDAPLILGGDLNVAPEDEDTFDPRGMDGQVLFHPEERKRLRALQFIGLTDAVRALDPRPDIYSWWDYRGGSWQRDHGLRIDHLLLAPKMADRLVASGVDKAPRALDKPSDHAPVWCELA
jgi:exodeoxyribonuclease-3